MQPLAALPVDLHGVEAVWKRLDLAHLYKLLLAECSTAKICPILAGSGRVAAIDP